MQNVSPDISVIMAIKAPAPWLGEALHSLKRQIGVSWELCAVMDGYDEKIEFQLQDLGEMVKIITMPAGSGPSISRNAALEFASARLSAVLDSDDIWLDSHLHHHYIKFENNPQLVLSGNSATIINSDGISTGECINVKTRYLKYHLLLRNCFVHSSVVYKTEKVIKIGGYSSRVWMGEDYDLFMRLALDGEICNSKTKSTFYRRHESQTSKLNFDMKSISEICKVRNIYGKKLRLPSLLTLFLNQLWKYKQRKNF